MGNILHGNRANMSRNPFTSFKKLGKVANKGICVCEREKEECWEILPDQKGLKILWSLSNDNLTANPTHLCVNIITYTWQADTTLILVRGRGADWEVTMNRDRIHTILF